MFNKSKTVLSATERLVQRRENSLKAIARHEQSLNEISKESQVEIKKHEKEINILKGLVN